MTTHAHDDLGHAVPGCAACADSQRDAYLDASVEYDTARRRVIDAAHLLVVDLGSLDELRVALGSFGRAEDALIAAAGRFAAGRASAGIR